MVIVKFDFSHTAYCVHDILKKLCFFARKRKAKADTADLKKDLRKMSKLASSLLLDQKALALAESVENGYDLAKYRKLVVQALSDEEDD